MDDAPYTDELDLASVTTQEELAALLRTVRLKADMPSLRALEARTRHDATPLRKTAVSDMLKGVRFPRKAVLVGFLRACGVRDDQLAPWSRAWERIAVRQYEMADRKVVYFRSAGQASAAAPSGQHPVDAANPQRTRLHGQIDQPDSGDTRLRREPASSDRRAEQQAHPADTANVPAMHSPIARRREIGILLRTLRLEKELTVEQVAERLMCKANKVKRMEASFRAGTLRDVRDLCDLYGVTDEAERARIMNLAIEGKQEGWWEPYDLDYATYAGLESEAVIISAFQSSVVHGLLQTADYARAGNEAAMPRFSPEQIDMQIKAKLTRQRILTQDKPPRFAAVLDEAALHRAAGGPQVMVAQLTKILDMSAMPNVVVQVLPFNLGAHPALESNFTILELPNQTPGIVFVEGLIGSIYLEGDDDLKRYHEIFSRLQSIALSPEDTADLIMDLRRSMRIS